MSTMTELARIAREPTSKKWVAYIFEKGDLVCKVPFAAYDEAEAAVISGQMAAGPSPDLTVQYEEVTLGDFADVTADAERNAAAVRPLLD